ncbi:MAG: hypothetical protein EBS17_06070 [Flavobacteriia bacterium]|nr:hypothetical protein [Flavobacteriia bacterium]
MKITKNQRVSVNTLKIVGVLMLVGLLFQGSLLAQGEALYKAKCSSCHQIEKNGTGPMLKGARQRWMDAGEGELIYEWVKNNAALRASGKSKRALTIFKEYGGSAMQIFADITPDQVNQILDYADAPPAAAQPGAGTGTAVADPNLTEEEEGGISNVWWLLAVLFIIVIMSVSGVRRQLKQATSEKPADTSLSYWEEFKVFAWRNRLISGIVGLVLTIALLVLVFQGLGTINLMENYQPSQPIAFPHSQHAGVNGIDCKYCHNSVEKSKSAGLPTVNVCMNCHKLINGKTPEQQAQIAKIYEAAGWDPNIKPAGAYTGKTKPIIWNKVHVLPDHVYFNHSQHVVAGKVNCTQCHGNMKEMKETAKVWPVEELNKVEGNIPLTKTTLTMGWCIECHGKKEVVIGDGSNAYYDEIHQRLKKNKKLYKQYLANDGKITANELGGWECAKCHY